ncbi:MAG: SprT-like domain-containing protein [Proteobacteria bacterium]|nr:SprT-like domain-containing protein [Pseudomonadota bacterium]MBU1738887.1 SprT-like domain-containing protein [Pseudomonadota bacterium]
MDDRIHHKYSGFWARQLHLEFENICWQYGLDLLPPVFEITGNTSRIGSWQAGTRTIRLSAELIIGQPWDTTVNVLKHEIAHQICSEIFSADTTSHGEQFGKACDLLGLPPGFRKAKGSLESLGNTGNNSTASHNAGRIITRVHKLLALAGSANSNEASLAMQKANEAIRKYNLELLQGDREQNHTYTIIHLNAGRIKGYQRQICAILRDFFFVKIITSSSYHPLKNKKYRTIEILGSTENVAIAEHCYHFLENRLKTLWGKEKHKFRAHARTEKNSYYLGLLKGFAEKLSAEKKEWDAKLPSGGDGEKIRALMLVEDKCLDGYVARRFPKLKTTACRGTRICRNTFDDGVRTGRKITVHKCVTSTMGYLGNLLSR